MTIIADENLIGTWVVGGAGGHDWLAGISRAPGNQIKLTYRFRYYVDAKTFDSADEKHWYQAGGPYTDDDTAIEMMRSMSQLIAGVWGCQVTELLMRNCAGVEDFCTKLSALPMMSTKHIPAEEAGDVGPT